MKDEPLPLSLGGLWERFEICYSVRCWSKTRIRHFAVATHWHLHNLCSEKIYLLFLSLTKPIRGNSLKSILGNLNMSTYLIYTREKATEPFRMNFNRCKSRCEWNDADINLIILSILKYRHRKAKHTSVFFSLQNYIYAIYRPGGLYKEKLCPWS